MNCCCTEAWLTPTTTPRFTERLQSAWALYDTHLTFAATEDIASLLIFFLLDTAVPMLKWKRPRGEKAHHSTDWSAREARYENKNHQMEKYKSVLTLRGHTGSDCNCICNYLIFVLVVSDSWWNGSSGEPRAGWAVQRLRWMRDGMCSSLLSSLLQLRLLGRKRRPYKEGWGLVRPACTARL